MSEQLLPPNRRIGNKNPFRNADGSTDWLPFLTFIIAGAAIVGLILGAIALSRTNYTIVTATANGAITADNVQYLAGTGARAMTLSAAQLGAMIGKTITIISTTAAAHTVTLSGGAVWVAGGAQTVATWPATAGTGLSFYVVSSTSIVVLSNNGPVVFS